MPGAEDPQSPEIRRRLRGPAEETAETVTLSGGQSVTVTSSTFGTQTYSTTPNDDQDDD
ncbi:hypothetical protein ACWFRJ_43490 [Streptomyces sp. NPDC055239]